MSNTCEINPKLSPEHVGPPFLWLSIKLNQRPGIFGLPLLSLEMKVHINEKAFWKFVGGVFCRLFCCFQLYAVPTQAKLM